MGSELLGGEGFVLTYICALPSISACVYMEAASISYMFICTGHQQDYIQSRR
jgi:hypothetical protein